jgi:hypothetical protein
MSNDHWIIDPVDRAVYVKKTFTEVNERWLIEEFGGPLIDVDFTDHFKFSRFITSAALGCLCADPYRGALWVPDGYGGWRHCTGRGQCRVTENELDILKLWKAELKPYARHVLPSANLTAWRPGRWIRAPRNWRDYIPGSPEYEFFYPDEEIWEGQGSDVRSLVRP